MLQSMELDLGLFLGEKLWKGHKRPAVLFNTNKMADPKIISCMTLKIYCKDESPRRNKLELELCKSRERFLEKMFFMNGTRRMIQYIKSNVCQIY